MDGETTRRGRGAEVDDMLRHAAELARRRALDEVAERRESAGRVAASWGLLELADMRDGLAALDGLLDEIGRADPFGEASDGGWDGVIGAVEVAERCARSLFYSGVPGAADAAGKLVTSSSGNLRQIVERFCAGMDHYREAAGRGGERHDAE